MSTVLQRPTLVLNRSWQPVNVATVERALVLVWNDVARIVDPESYQIYDWADWAELTPKDDEPAIRTVQRRLRAPEVITLNRYDRVPKVVVSFSRRNIFKRDGYRCQYCGAQPGTNELSIDHVIPRSRGGGTSWENCVLACIDCNKTKGNRTPEEAHMKLRKTPVRPHWRPIYSTYHMRIDSWSRFLSEAYWNAELESD